MAYQKPQAIIHQQFETVPRIVEDELRAVIVGPSAILHRYADVDEKIDIYVGVYDPDNDSSYEYPGRSAGGVVDYDYSKLYVDNALLSYFNSIDHNNLEDGVMGVTAPHIVSVQDENNESHDELNYTAVYLAAVNVGPEADATDLSCGSTIDKAAAIKAVSANTPLKLYTYDMDAADRPYYYRVISEDQTYSLDKTLDPYGDGVCKYEDGVAMSFVHVFKEAKTEDNEQLYVSSDLTGYTIDPEEAYNLAAGEEIPIYIKKADNKISKYKFICPYEYDNAVVSDVGTSLNPKLEFNFRSTLDTPRNGALGVRDVQVGDYAMIWGNVREGDRCNTYGPQISRIIGFIPAMANATYGGDIEFDQPETSAKVDPQFKEAIGVPITSIANFTKIQETAIEADDTVNPPIEAVAVSQPSLITFKNTDPDTGGINPFKYGIREVGTEQLKCTYSIVVADIVTQGNCEGTIYMTVSCADTGESRTVQLVANDSIMLSEGETYGRTSFSCTAEQIELIRAAFDAGSTLEWQYQVGCAYNKLTKDNVEVYNWDNYTGNTDTYIVSVTRGERPATVVKGSTYSVTTAYGVDNVNNVTLTQAAWGNDSGAALGTQGLKFRFKSTTSVTTSKDISIPASFRMYIPVKGVTERAYIGILLADNIIPNLQTKADTAAQEIEFNLALLYNDDIELPQVSPVTDALNWKQENYSFWTYEAATTVDPQFVNLDGTYIPLHLLGFEESANTSYNRFSKMFFNYREWSPVHANDVTFCENVGNLDNIIGPLDPDNPLKWAVYKALTNSDGASVAYVAVKDPTDLDDWQDAMDIIEGRDDVYTIVPLSTRVDVQNLVLTLVNAESAAEACRWKTALFNMELPLEVMRIGQSENNATHPTSTDGLRVQVSIVENPLDTDKPINKVICTSGNAKFIDYGVVPGDEVRMINADGSVRTTYVVDQIYSNGTLTITKPLNKEVQKDEIEIWHKYTRNEEVELIRQRAQSTASRRVGLVWPDIVEEGGVEMPGYYLSAALAGLKSGVEPQNGLTRRTIQGFDGFTRSKPRYTESQLDLMASSGVWVCVTDSDGTPQSRHALNTDTTNTFYSEEMMTRNFDSISKYMYQVIDAYIGTSNVTNTTLRSIYSNIVKACDYLIGKGQMIDYTRIVVKQHDLLLDRVLAYLDVGLPFAVNNVELFITAEAYKLNAVTLESEGNR